MRIVFQMQRRIAVHTGGFVCKTSPVFLQEHCGPTGPRRNLIRDKALTWGYHSCQSQAPLRGKSLLPCASRSGDCRREELRLCSCRNTSSNITQLPAKFWADNRQARIRASASPPEIPQAPCNNREKCSCRNTVEKFAGQVPRFTTQLLQPAACAGRRNPPPGAPLIGEIGSAALPSRETSELRPTC